MSSLLLRRPRIGSLAFLAGVALCLTAFYNAAFYLNVINVYPARSGNIGFLISVAWVFTAVTFLLLSLVCFRHTTKPVVITLLMLSSVAAYFMDSYNAIIDESMLRNVAHTDVAETTDLLSLKLVLYVALLGVLPSVLVYRANIVFAPVRKLVTSRLKWIGLAAASMAAVIVIYGDFYSSFIREHKQLRYYSNPGGYINAAASFAGQLFHAKARVLRPEGLDAHIPETDTHRELIVMVVGETARADHFSLNGYPRETNPLLRQKGVNSFTNYWSCGTSTAISVPCMFAVGGASGFDSDTAGSTENLLDVLTHAGVNVLWLDNNSDSKGVAERVAYQSYREPDVNPVCDVECRDEGMLGNLQKYIDEHPQGDIFVVLHQMGNHGPAYYKRYPPAFERFTPVCKTNQLQDCSKEEIGNAYDNAILYTDYFLSRVIDILENNDGAFEAAMFYVSDHGESLGEHGLYLHGLPKFIAPEEQRHVPAILWIGDNFNEIDTGAIVARRDESFTHDNIFHTVLGFMEIETALYDKNMDLLVHREEMH